MANTIYKKLLELQKAVVEEWKDIAGYDGYYQVSNMGRVRSLDRYVDASYGSKQIRHGKVLKTELMPNGYLAIRLCKGAKYKSFYVHRLVASAFIPNPANLPEVNHKDRNTQNAVASNLEWCTRTYNASYMDAPKIRGQKYAKKVVVFDSSGKLIDEFPSATQAAVHFGKWKRTILGYLWGEHKNKDGLIFKYK